LTANSQKVANRSESQFQRELERPWAALLEERIQTDSARQPLIQHYMGLELGGTERYEPRRVCEVRMIQEIESIPPETEDSIFRDRKFPSNRKIHLREPESGNVGFAARFLAGRLKEPKMHPH